MINNIVIEKNISKDGMITIFPGFLCSPTYVITVCDWVPNCILTRIFVVIAVTILSIQMILYDIFQKTLFPFPTVCPPLGHCGEMAVWDALNPE